MKVAPLSDDVEEKQQDGAEFHEGDLHCKYNSGLCSVIEVIQSVF